jgi:para-aminobenzoate synthetase component 1
VCIEGSVEVEELFGIYSFPYVHQMISTISGTLKENIGLAEILKATFPMGSMTGAPKIKVMELIERYESSKRGIYSGAVGYISPEKDFDFNVVIRSIVYDQQTSYISYHVGSAITFCSNPEQEYEECLLKAKGISQIFAGTSNA